MLAMEIMDDGDGSSEELAVAGLNGNTGSGSVPKAAPQKKSEAQVNRLKEVFEANQNPSMEERKKLATELGLTDMQVTKWFIGQRAKLKRNAEASAASPSPSPAPLANSSTKKVEAGTPPTNDEILWVKNVLQPATTNASNFISVMSTQNNLARRLLMLQFLKACNNKEFLEQMRKGASILVDWLKEFQSDDKPSAIRVTLEVFQRIPLTITDLSELRLGQLVKAFKKHPSEDLAQLASKLLHSWKVMLEVETKKVEQQQKEEEERRRKQEEEQARLLRQKQEAEAARKRQEEEKKEALRREEAVRKLIEAKKLAEAKRAATMATTTTTANTPILPSSSLDLASDLSSIKIKKRTIAETVSENTNNTRQSSSSSPSSEESHKTKKNSPSRPPKESSSSKGFNRYSNIRSEQLPSDKKIVILGDKQTKQAFSNSLEYMNPPPATQPQSHIQKSPDPSKYAPTYVHSSSLKPKKSIIKDRQASNQNNATKKNVTFAPDQDLEQIQYIPPRETGDDDEHSEMSHVLFMEMREKERRLSPFPRDMEIAEMIEWRTPKLIAIPEDQIIERGRESQIFEEQQKRESTTLRSMFTSAEHAPPTPGEPDPETEMFEGPPPISIPIVDPSYVRGGDLRNLPPPVPSSMDIPMNSSYREIPMMPKPETKLMNLDPKLIDKLLGSEPPSKRMRHEEEDYDYNRGGHPVSRHPHDDYDMGFRPLASSSAYHPPHRHPHPDNYDMGIGRHLHDYDMGPPPPPRMQDDYDYDMRPQGRPYDDYEMPPRSESKKTVKCKFFFSKGCSKGDHCTFSHVA